MRPYKFSKPLIESANPPKSKNVYWVDIDEKDNDILTIKECREGEWVNIIKDGSESGDFKKIFSYLPGVLSTEDARAIPIQDIDPTSESSYRIFLLGMYEVDDSLAEIVFEDSHPLDAFMKFGMGTAMNDLGQYLKKRFIDEVNNIPAWTEEMKKECLDLLVPYLQEKTIVGGHIGYTPDTGVDDGKLEAWYMQTLASDDKLAVAKLDIRDTKYSDVLIQFNNLSPEDPKKTYYLTYFLGPFCVINAFLCVDQAQEHAYLAFYSIRD